MRRILAAAALSSLVFAACSGGAGDGADGDVDGRLRVVAGFFPRAEAAQRVGGDRVAVTDLTPSGAEPHDLELTTDQVDAIEDADVVLYLGGGFQPAVEEAAERAKGTAVDLLPSGDQGDPHVWLDPVRMAAIVERVRDALAAASDDAAAPFAAAAEDYATELRSLDEDYRTGLADCDRRVFVSAHEAFGRLAERYDLQAVAVAGLAPESEPDPRRLAELVEDVEARGVTTVFTEAGGSADVAETLAREAGVRTDVLDTLEAKRDGGATYLSVMRENLSALRAALGCR